MIHQSIKTTLSKAKAVKPEVEKLISLIKLNTLAAKREAFKILGSHELVSKTFKEIGPRFAQTSGGFTRIISLGKRRGDNAEQVVFELTQIVKKEPKKHKKEKEVKPEEPAQSPEAPKVQPKPPAAQKPTKKFLGGLRGIFKKERDAL